MGAIVEGSRGKQADGSPDDPWPAQLTTLVEEAWWGGHHTEEGLSLRIFIFCLGVSE